MAKSLEDTGYLLIFALFKDKCYENRMESMQYDKYVALDILNRVHISIEHIEERSQPYHCGDDFLMSSTGRIARRMPRSA